METGIIKCKYRKLSEHTKHTKDKDENYIQIH